MKLTSHTNCLTQTLSHTHTLAVHLGGELAGFRARGESFRMLGQSHPVDVMNRGGSGAERGGFRARGENILASASAEMLVQYADPAGADTLFVFMKRGGFGERGGFRARGENIRASARASAIATGLRGIRVITPGRITVIVQWAIRTYPLRLIRRVADALEPVAFAPLTRVIVRVMLLNPRRRWWWWRRCRIPLERRVRGLRCELSETMTPAQGLRQITLE